MQEDDLLDELNATYGFDNALQFRRHQSGLVEAIVKSSNCEGGLFLLGAHVFHFQPTKAKVPLLFMSQSALFEEGKPIRGGIPICFPWFGPKKESSPESSPTAQAPASTSFLPPQPGSAPAHGLVRTVVWQVIETAMDSKQVTIVLGIWMDPWEIRYEVRFGESLEVEFTATNRSDQRQSFEVALHTYFLLSKIESIRIEGLESQPFLDQLTQQLHPMTQSPIQFDSETDRIYQGEVSRIQIHDPGFRRRVEVLPQSSHSTVVWNPWIDKSKRMADFGDEEYKQMCCVETANVGDGRIQLDSGMSHSTSFQLNMHEA